MQQGVQALLAFAGGACTPAMGNLTKLFHAHSLISQRRGCETIFICWISGPVRMGVVQTQLLTDRGSGQTRHPDTKSAKLYLFVCSWGVYTIICGQYLLSTGNHKPDRIQS